MNPLVSTINFLDVLTFGATSLSKPAFEILDAIILGTDVTSTVIDEVTKKDETSTDNDESKNKDEDWNF